MSCVGTLISAPNELDPYQRKFICTHGWSERERSTGKRTSHNLLRTFCPFQMLAQVTKKPDGTGKYTHKPSCDQRNLSLHPRVRQVPADSPLMPGIEMMVEARAATPSIYNFIRSNSNHRVNMDDVRDLLTRMRNTGKLRRTFVVDILYGCTGVQLSDNDAVAELILGFNQESPKNVSSVHETPNDLTEIDDPFVAKLYKSKQAETNSDGHLSGPEKRNFERELSAFDQWWYNLRQGHAASEQENILPKDRDNDGSGGGTSTKIRNLAVVVATLVLQGNLVQKRGCSSHSAYRDTATINRSITLRVERVRMQKAKVALKEYNKGMKLRGLLRDKDICDVVATILEIKPGVNELGSYLAICRKTKTPAKVFGGEWIPTSSLKESGIGYRICSKYALEKLHSGLAKDEEIEIDSEGEQDPQRIHLLWLSRKWAIGRNAVAVEHASRLSKRGSLLHMAKSQCQAERRRPCSTASYAVASIGDWPSTAINGFGFDLFYSDLYCLRGDAWLNTTRCERLLHSCASSRTTPYRFYTGSITVMNQTLEFVLLPVNLQGVHWGGLVVERPGKKVEVYDSMNGKKNRKQLKRLATEVIKGALLRRSTRYKTWPNPPRRTATIVAHLSAVSFGALSVATSLKIFQMWTSPSFGGKFLLRF
ncbi:Ulp1 protease family, C-terminal catalytic domain [Phytophthora cactorum]|nr:Ulp1 protease family, C-terminal catalytic domain [Phytophthora cactorum]